MRKIIFSILILSLLISLIPVSSANVRGVYIYDDAKRISTESELGLEASLWKLDVKTNNEVVLAFSTEKLDIPQMEAWFNNHGVGKKDINEGIVIFIFPDNSVYAMIGSGQGSIAVPLLSTFGSIALKNIDDDTVLSLLKLINIMREKLDEPTVTDKALTVGYFVKNNIGEIIFWATSIIFLLLLIQQRDGFQASDLILPGIFLVLSLIFIGISMIPSDSLSRNVNEEFGIITNTTLDQHQITETHSYKCGKSTCYRTDHHTIYTNDVIIKSYDLREYKHRFDSRDNKWSWSIKIDTPIRLGVYENGKLDWVDLNMKDNSGGITERYGTWIIKK